jgi:hypothetical protein
VIVTADGFGGGGNEGIPGGVIASWVGAYCIAPAMLRG